MICDICSKDHFWLVYVGKDSVCNNCIAKYTIFKEIKTNSEARLKFALRSLDINSFEDLVQIKEYQIDDLMAKRASKSKIRYKTVTKAVKAIDSMDEYDQLW